MDRPGVSGPGAGPVTNFEEVKKGATTTTTLLIIGHLLIYDHLPPISDLVGDVPDTANEEK